MTTPPRTPPYYGDLWTGREEGLPPAAEAAALVDSFAQIPQLLPDWIIDGDDEAAPFTVALVAHETGRRAVLELRGAGIVAEASFAADPSGYVLVTGRRDGTELFRAYLDRPYEEFDLWPEGASFDPKRVAEAPGRIGKRRSWVVLDTRTWPALGALANSAGFVMARDRE